MFDEFVEHPGSPHGRVTQSVDFQGFDDAPSSPPQQAESQALPQAPIFQLGAVVFEDSIPDRIAAVAVSSDVLVVAFVNNQFFVLELSQTRRIAKYDLPRKRTEFSLNKIFLDPTGRHLLLNSIQGETFYLFRGWGKPAKLLKKLSSYKIVIQSIAWSRHYLLSSNNSPSTGEFLVGTHTGAVFEACLDAEEDFFKSQERFIRKVYTLPEGQAVTGLFFEYFPPSDLRKCVIILATHSRLHLLVGLPEKRSGEDIFGTVFAKYKEHLPAVVELLTPSTASSLSVRILRPSRLDSLPSSFAWLTDSGVYRAQLNFKTSSDDFIDGLELFAHTPKGPPAPRSLTATQFHFVILNSDRVLALNSLLGKTAYEELLPLKQSERVIGCEDDPMASTYWIYTDLSLYELKVLDEERDIWSAFLSKGDFESALQYARNPRERAQVYGKSASVHLGAGRYIQAAQSYAQSLESFDEVVLRFLELGQRDALRYYLISRLEKTRKTERPVRMMVATWLLELYLSKYNQLEDVVSSGSLARNTQDIKVELNLLGDELKQFLDTYKNDLHRGTAYELIRSFGRNEFLIHFAGLVGDHDLVIQHWIHEERWEHALDALKRQSSRELYYTHASILLRNRAADTVDAWIRLPALDPVRLVPALTQSLQATEGEPIVEHCLRYLKHIIFEGGNSTPVLQNLLLSLLVSNAQSAETYLLKLLEEPTNQVGQSSYDLDFALRLCLFSDLIRPSVLLYAKMGLWEESVDLALGKGEFELATANADMASDDIALRKRLWLKIATFLVKERQDIKSAMRLLETTDILKIEDILPLFPDFIKIDDFKEEICSALEDYSRHIDSLRNGMEEATRNAESIKADIGELRNRFVTLSVSENCCHCHEDLFGRQFYVFPCYHGIHVDCLINLIKQGQPQHILRRILALQTAITIKTGSATNLAEARGERGARALLSANYVPNGRTVVNAAGSLGRGFLTAGDRLRDLIVPESLAAIMGGWTGRSGDNGARQDRDGRSEEKLKEELDGMLAGSCPLCDDVVLGVDTAFVSGERQGDWDI